jgi:N,N'-diacetyllegionaminate synthase
VNRIDIETHRIASGGRTFVIAEIGVNHDGSVGRAIELVRHARAAGADAIKLQLFSAANLVHPTAAAAGYQVESCGAVDQATLLRKYELRADDVERIVDAASVAGLMTIATPFSVEDVRTIDEMNLPMIKIASPDLVNKPLLRRCADSRRPMLISTGAATIEEIERTCEWLAGWLATFALLHCVSSYPTRDQDVNLEWIGELADRFDVPVGFSDHSTDLSAGALARACGACVIEKHLTWNRFAEGPDHSASADPHQFELYVRAIRSAERLCGVAGKRVLDSEIDVRRLSRQSIVAVRPIPSGRQIVAADLRVQRPGTGVCASCWDDVIGQPARRDIAAGEFITESDFAAATRVA